MKAKQLLLSLTAAVALSLFFGSCAGDMSVTKRRYNKGFYISMRDHGTPAVNAVAVAPVAETKEAANTVATAPETAVAQQPAITTTPEVNTTVATPTATSPIVKHVSENPAQPKSIAPTKQAAKAAIRQAKRTMHHAPAGDSQVLAVILAILIPPLGVWLYEGSITNHFWIDLILTLIFFFPGMIYALLVVLDAI